MVGSPENLVNVKLGRRFVIEAVSKLWHYNKQSGERTDEETRNYLAGSIVIICEAARMDKHYTAVKEDWDKPIGVDVRYRNKKSSNKVEVKYIRNRCWRTMSRALLLWRNKRCPDKYPFSNRYLKKIGITSPARALQIVRLVLNYSLSRPTLAGGSGQSDEPPSSKRGKFEQQRERGGRFQEQQQQQQGRQEQQHQGRQGGRSHSQQQGTDVPPGAADEYEVHGRPLAEVYSVRASKPLVGTITIFDGKRGQIIYKDGPTQDFPLSPDDGVVRELLLTGPYKAISADGSFTIEVEDLNSNETREVTWDCYDEENIYDKPAKLELAMNGGQKIEVTYAVLDDAVEANVEVYLRFPQGTAQNCVYGEITAHSQSHGQYLPPVVLLDPKLKREVPVAGSWVQLQLARSVLAVPSDFPQVVISATLYDQPYREGITPIFECKDLNLSLCNQHSGRHEDNGVEVEVIISSPHFNPYLPDRWTEQAHGGGSSGGAGGSGALAKFEQALMEFEQVKKGEMR